MAPLNSFQLANGNFQPYNIIKITRIEEKNETWDLNLLFSSLAHCYPRLTVEDRAEGLLMQISQNFTT